MEGVFLGAMIASNWIHSNHRLHGAIFRIVAMSILFVCFLIDESIAQSPNASGDNSQSLALAGMPETFPIPFSLQATYNSRGIHDVTKYDNTEAGTGYATHFYDLNNAQNAVMPFSDFVNQYNVDSMAPLYRP